MSFTKFFSNVQETNWYRTFLNPVISEITSTGNLLDVGTGTGKLLQIVTVEKGMTCVGIDINQEMLSEAKKKLEGTQVKLLRVEANASFPFQDNSFEYITICNVLFNVSHEQVDKILQDSIRILKKDGKIIVLTPTGSHHIISLTKNYFSFKNRSIYIWYFATKNRARLWTKHHYLKQYAVLKKLNYRRHIVMNGFAQLEVLTM